MNPRDLQIGMYLKNEGTTGINVYDDLSSASGKIMTTIAPGEVIGQIADIHGNAVDFISDKIQASGSIGEKLKYYAMSWLLDDVKIAGSVSFDDIASNVSDAQVQKQAQILAAAAANGNSISNQIVKIAKEVGDTAASAITGAIPLTPIIIFAGGWLLFTNRDKVSKKVFK